MFQFASQLRIKFMQLRRYFLKCHGSLGILSGLIIFDPHALGVKNEKNSLIDIVCVLKIALSKYF